MTPEAARARLIAALALPERPTSDHDLNPETQLAPGRVLRPAGVLIGVSPAPGGARLWLTKRASHLKHHPGQIALPGGKVDPGDGGPLGAALRESEEEIGLPREQVEVLGTGGAHETVTGFAVTPVIGWIARPFTPVAEAGEVEEIFSVPLAQVMDPARYRIEGRDWRGSWRRYYTVPHGPYYIWGATARILRALAERWQQCG